MYDVKDSAMIALLPINSDWCKQELPHLTLVYAGKIQDFRPNAFNDLAKDTAALAMMCKTITLRAMGLDVFGDEKKVDVIRLRNTPELMAMRRPVEIWNASEYPFNPHVTIGPVGELLEGYPGYIAFDRIMVTFGSESMTFRLAPS